ncbi:hypothetical protein D9M68_648810 [compost metagenome]
MRDAGVLGQRHDGEQVPEASGRRLSQRGVVGDEVTVLGQALVFLTPGMGVLWNIGGLEYGGVDSVFHPVAAIEDLAQGVHARGRQVVEEVPAPAARAFLVGGGARRVEVVGAGVVVVADKRVEIAVVVDATLVLGQVALVADVEDAVAVQVGGVVIGFVVQLVVAPHHQHVERWNRVVHEYRGLGNVDIPPDTGAG